jgi:hypothetical protein
MWIKRNDEYLDWNGTEEEFNNTSLPIKGWEITTAPEPVPAPIYVPTTVTMRQARLQLAHIELYNMVNQAVATMGDLAMIEWEYAAVIERSNPFVQGMIQLLGWTEEQADTFFIEAEKR